MSAYRTTPIAPTTAPRAPWRRLAWAWCRGVFWRVAAARERRVRAACENVRRASILALLDAIELKLREPAPPVPLPRPPRDLQA